MGGKMIADILFVFGVFLIGFTIGGKVAYWRWVKTCYSPSTANVSYKNKEYRALEQKVEADMEHFARSAERYARGKDD
jgi:hypothetical protein